MSETRTISVPSIALNYDEGMLESVGIGGEIFRRETPLSAENAQLKSENASLRGSVRWFVIENVELRDLVSDYAAMAEYLLARQPMLFPDKAKELQELDEKRRELGIEVER